ncbi:hypothetical protein EYF80_062289 [Liparis tanakae]|uniref:Uncharacterized protein n=1 Tax=Liparis tanakae TaxID=230148 RepID=A0A4Z2EFR7_9TELE|nr:hypothetical protein EYF80_062289 [Liparis tanakae]
MDFEKPRPLQVLVGVRTSVTTGFFNIAAGIQTFSDTPTEMTHEVCGTSRIRSLSAARSLPGARLSATGLSEELDSASERRHSSRACRFPDDVLHEASICFSSMPLAECEGLLGMPTSTNVSEPEGTHTKTRFDYFLNFYLS